MDTERAGDSKRAMDTKRAGDAQRATLSKRAARGLLVVISLLFIVACYPCLKWSLPRPGNIHSNASDEFTPLQMFRMMEPRALNFDPHYQVSGALGYYYMGAFIAAGGVMGAYPLAQDVGALRKDVRYLARIYLAGRLSSLLMGIALLWLVYALASLFWDRETGVVAAALCAFTPGMVMNASTMTHNMTATFFIFLSIYLGARYVGNPSFRAFALAAVVAGCALSVKFSAITVPGALVAARLATHGFGERRTTIAWLSIAAIIMVLAFMVTSPYFVPNIVRGTEGSEAAPFSFSDVVSRALGWDYFGGFVPTVLSAPKRIASVIMRQVGLGELLLGLVGWVMMLRHAGRWRRMWPLWGVFLTLLPVLMIVGSNYVDKTRIMALYPAVSMGAAVALVTWVRRTGVESRRWVGALVVGGVMLWQLTLITSVDAAHRAIEVQETASDWILANVPPRATIVTMSAPSYHHPDLLEHEYSLYLGRHPEEARDTEYGFDVIESADSVLAERPEWLVLTQFEFEVFDRAGGLNEYRVVGDIPPPVARPGLPLNLFWYPTMIYEVHIRILARSDGLGTASRSGGLPATLDSDGLPGVAHMRSPAAVEGARLHVGGLQ